MNNPGMSKQPQEMQSEPNPPPAMAMAKSTSAQDNARDKAKIIDKVEMMSQDLIMST